MSNLVEAVRSKLPEHVTTDLRLLCNKYAYPAAVGFVAFAVLVKDVALHNSWITIHDNIVRRNSCEDYLVATDAVATA